MKKLYRKAKKGFKKRITSLFHKKDKELCNPQLLKKIKISNNLKPKVRSENFKKIGSLRNSFKKAKEKIKSFKHKKQKVISSKKLALLLTAATVATLLPMFHLTPVPALVAASTCVFTINFIMVKSVKKFLKHRKQPSSNIQNISIELEKKANRIE